MIDIAWSQFTPGAALTGGLLIGLAAASFLLLNGRIAGISGILGGLLVPARRDILWRVAFLAGLVGTPSLWLLFSELPPIQVDAGYPALILAGLLVGIGTRYGSGCTSGACDLCAWLQLCASRRRELGLFAARYDPQLDESYG